MADTSDLGTGVAAAEARMAGAREKAEQFRSLLEAVAGMVSAALELSEDDGVETPMLHELHDMLMKLPGPVQDMQGDVGNAIDALVPLIEVARGVEEHGLALAERESIVETSERNLDMAESEVAEQKTAFDRTMEDHKHELLVARAAGGQEGVEALESELIELRLKARAAEDASASKSRLVAKRTGDLQACKDQIERLKAANASLREEMRHTVKAYEKRVAGADMQLAELNRTLAHTQDEKLRSQDLLASETRKQRVLQYALQKELSSRGGGASPVSTPTRAWDRAQSAPSHGRSRPEGERNVDVAGMIRRNQELLSELGNRRTENFRLRQDNSHLLLHAKDANQGSHLLRAQVTTSVANRAELLRNLECQKEETQKWKKQLQRTAERMVQRHQLERAAEEEARWDRIELLGERSRNSPRKLSDGYKPRHHRNIAVEKWGASRS